MALAKTLDIPRDIFNRTSNTATVDDVKKIHNETAKDFLNTQPKHYEEITFSSNSVIINKNVGTKTSEMNDLIYNPLNRKIFLICFYLNQFHYISFYFPTP